MPIRRAARIAAIALACLAYVLGSHWLMTRVESSAWSVVVLLLPTLAAVGGGAWRSGHRGWSVCALLALLALCVQASLGVRISAHALYLAQYVGIYLFLAMAFGATLRSGQTALITALAHRVHGNRFTPAMAAYTRKLTQVWVMFFVCMVGVSIALYLGADFEVWAVFSNLVTPVALAVMFVGEHLIRFRLHPDFARSTLADAVRAYMHTAKSPTQSAQP